MSSKDIILFVHDKPTNFSESVRHIGTEGVTYKRIINFTNLDEFKEKLNSPDITSEDKIFVVVHVFSETLDGVKEFHVSGVIESFDFLHFKYITNKGTINEMCKKAIDDDLPLCKKDVFKYHDIRNYVKSNYHKIPTKEKLLSTIDDNRNPEKKGIFLSHSSSDKDVVLKFKELLLELGLEVNSRKIKFTSVEEECGEKGGIDIPEDLRNFLKNEMGFFIQFISEDYKNSETCINEEGAAWVLLDDIMFLSIMLPKVTSKKISWIKNDNKGIKINNSNSLINIYNHRKDFFGDIDFAKFNSKIIEFINWLPKS